ncbi:MAG: PQQ-binding-like beta-propeller repeat protein [Thermoguttaceae bacterium]|jgi:outer membrane protein assembly factor BamB
MTTTNRASAVFLGLTILAFSTVSAPAGDWLQFRGPDGSGISRDTQPLPVKWSETENLKWKRKLPGPGSSSPILVGKRVFVTCWTGYGTDRDNPGDQKDLRRHLICLDRATGDVLWDRSVEPVLPEDPYSGNFTEHGYASHTPVSDGKRVYVFFGRTGAVAFDLDGKKLWQTGAGTGSGPHGWGTASSPILYKNLLIVTASAESQSLVALDKETGNEVWRRQDPALSGTWGTPVLVDCGQGRTDLVLSVPFKILGLDPQDGKPRWQCEGLSTDFICSSALASDGVVYALETGPRGGGTMAVRAGGEGDVTKTRVLWRGIGLSRIGTPLLDGGRIYWFTSRTANCIDAATGKQVYRTRVDGGAATPAPPPPGPKPGQPGPGGPARKPGGKPGGPAGIRGMDYSSPVLADGKIYYVSRSGETFVYATGPEFKLLGQNRFAPDGGDFSATPAVGDGELFIRSSKYLYCVALPGGKGR